MVKRVILGRTGEEKIVDLIKAISDKASAGQTTPAGTKVLDDDEDLIWSRPDGTEHSVRDVDAELEGARGRIEDAEQSLAESQVRLDEAEQTIASTAEDLTRVETVVIPAAVEALEQADQAAQQELTTLDGKLVTARTDLDAARDSLDNLRDVELPEMRQALEQADADAQEVLGQLDGKLATAEGEISTAKENITQLETDLAAESDARDQLAQNVQGTFDELDTRLGDFATDEALAPIRQALTDAQDAVQTAQGVAQAANQAANAASQAALEAAGIAASKGRVIIQETEPVGEDRNAANIWIKPIPDNPDTEIEEKAITYVYLEGSNEWVPTSSDELAQAAQNALDAREAAQQAQQRAETAISNAAAAQSAAEAAQQTADTATLDAREAHNEAVEARQAADNALAAATNLIPNGDFEVDGGGEVFQNWTSSTQWEIVKDPDDAHQGYSFLRLIHTGDHAPWAYTVAEPAVISGRTYRFSIAMRITNGTATGSNGGMAPLWYDADGGSINRSAEYPYSLWLGGRMLSELTDEWQVFTGDVVAPSDAVKIRPRLYFNTNAFSPGTIVDIDALSLVDVTDALAAEAVAKAAQDRADEAYAEAASKLDESQVDAKITASANGKNSITRSLNPPSGDGVVRGDQWYQVDGHGDAFASWYWAGSAWTPSLIKNEMMESLDVHKLKVTGDATMDSAVIDKLWADGIAAKAITAQQVTVAPGNSFPDPSGLNVGTRNSVGGASWAWHETGSYWYRSAVKNGTTQFNAYLNTTTGYDSGSLTPGTTYRIAYDVWVNGSTTSSTDLARAAIYYRRTDGSTSFVADGTTGDSIPVNQWTHIERTWVAPSDAMSGGFALQLVSTNGTATQVRIRNPYVGVKAGAVDIQNGVVSADHVNASSVGAAVGEFVEAEVGNLRATKGTVGEAVIDKLWADGIAAKSITASRLAVSPGNIFPDPYFQEEAKWSHPGGGVVKGSIPQENVLRIETTTAAQRGTYYGSSADRVVTYSPGTTYKISFEVKATNPAARLYVYLRTNGPSASSGYSSGVTLSGGDTWTTYEWTYTYPANPPNGHMGTIGLYTVGAYVANHVIDVRNVQVVPMVGAVLIENGAIGADQIRANEVGAEVGKFVEAEVGNLKATTGTVGEAVIDKIWADGIAAKAITASRVVVAPGNLIPGMAEIGAGKRPDPDPFSGWSLNSSGYLYTTGTTTLNIEAPISVEAGKKYKLTFDVNGSIANTRYYVQVMGANADGSTGGANPGVEGSTNTYIASNVVVGTANTWHTQEIEWTPASSGYAILRFYTNHGNGTSTSTTVQRFRRFSLRPMTGATLIEDGAVTTNKLTVTGDMSAAIVNAMTTNTKKLVVTKEAILNHATLIGQTVVDDINVNGKLVGTNGVFTGTVDFANVNVTGELLADTILADKGLVAGGPDGQVVIDGAGVTRYETDSDGQQIETFRLGPQGGDIATFGDTTISPEGIGSPEGAFEQLSVGGEDLGTILSALPRGMRAWGQLKENSKFDSDTSKFARRAELQTTLLPDRLYRIHLSSHLLDVEGSTNATVREELRYSLDQTNITTGISPDSGREEYTGTWIRQHVYSGDTRAAPGMEFLLDTEGWTEERHFWLMFMVLPEQASRPVRVVARWDYPVTLSVEDIGPSQPGLLKRWNDGSGSGSQDTAPTTRRYTKTYTSTGYNTYDSDGSPSSPKPADVVQGLYGGGPSRLRRRGGWSFPSFTSDLSGATVEKIEAYVYMNHSYYAAGADVNIATHNGTLSNLTSRVTVKGWKRNSGKWVTLPKSLYNGFKSGTYKGVGVISTSSSAQQYARFNGSGAKIRITYVK